LINEFAICDHFKWKLEDVRNLTLREFSGLKLYLKKLDSERKKAERKSKRR